MARAAVDAYQEAAAPAFEQQRRRQLTPLLMASEVGNVEMVRLLLDSKANPNLTSGARDQDASPLMQAATWGESPEICDMLLAAGADPDHQDRNRMTAWDYVIQLRGRPGKREKMMAYFTSKGLDGDPRQPVDRMMDSFPNMVEVIKKHHAGFHPLTEEQLAAAPPGFIESFEKK